jgi:hypothetical protein
MLADVSLARIAAQLAAEEGVERERFVATAGGLEI